MSCSGEMELLLVEDEPQFADLTASSLERIHDDFTVMDFQRPSGALSHLREASVDCVVSDYDMPEMNGLALLQEIREEYPGLPFILFTGKGSEEIASEAISAGVTDYLQKGGKSEKFRVLANRVEKAVERRRAEQEIRRAHEAMEAVGEGISLLNESGEFIYLNEAYAEMLGYDREALLGKHWEALYPDEDVEMVYEEVLPAVRTGRWSGETEYIGKDGERILTSHLLTYTDDGSLACVARDITERRQLESALAEERALLDEALDALDDLFYVLDTDGNVLRANQRAATVTGYSKAELQTMHATDFFATGEQSRVEATIRETIETGRSEAELNLQTAAASSLPYEFRTSRLEGSDGVIGVAGVGRTS